MRTLSPLIQERCRKVWGCNTWETSVDTSWSTVGDDQNMFYHVFVWWCQSNGKTISWLASSSTNSKSNMGWFRTLVWPPVKHVTTLANISWCFLENAPWFLTSACFEHYFKHLETIFQRDLFWLVHLIHGDLMLSSLVFSPSTPFLPEKGQTKHPGNEQSAHVGDARWSGSRCAVNFLEPFLTAPALKFSWRCIAMSLVSLFETIWAGFHLCGITVIGMVVLIGSAPENHLSQVSAGWECSYFSDACTCFLDAVWQCGTVWHPQFDHESRSKSWEPVTRAVVKFLHELKLRTSTFWLLLQLQQSVTFLDQWFREGSQIGSCTWHWRIRGGITSVANCWLDLVVPGLVRCHMWTEHGAKWTNQSKKLWNFSRCLLLLDIFGLYEWF